MNKKTLLLFALLFIVPNVLAVTPSDACFGSGGPSDLMQGISCVAQTALFGYDVAIAILLIIILYVEFKWNAPFSVMAPTILIFAGIFIGYKIMSTKPFEAMFFYGLVIIGALFGIGILKLLWR